MKDTRFYLAIAALNLLVATGNATADVSEEFAKLEREFEAASSAYYMQLEKLHAVNPELDLAKPENRPSDPRAAILDRMDRLVKTNAKPEDARDMAGAVLFWSIEAGDKRSPKRFEEFVTRGPEPDGLVEFLNQLEYAYTAGGESDAWTNAIRKLATATKSIPVKNQARFLLAKIAMDSNRASEAAQTFKSLQSVDDEFLAERAKGFYYEANHLQEGMQIPDFEATTIDGKKIKISSLRGKTVLIDFWATWCPPCVAEIPHMQEAARKFGHRFTIISISADDSRETVQKFVEKRPIPGFITWDMKDERFPLLEKFNIQGLPTWILVDPSGRIQEKDSFGDKLIPAIQKSLKTTS